jgi:hypothetical protein
VESPFDAEAQARIAATLKGDFVIRRESPWIVDANGNALNCWHLALGMA